MIIIIINILIILYFLYCFRNKEQFTAVLKRLTNYGVYSNKRPGGAPIHYS